MSENLHICRPHEPRFQVRVRRLGCRKYELVGRPYMDFDQAWRRLCKKMGENRHHAPHWTKYKRGDILMVSADPMNDWYGPSVLEEIICR